MTLHLTEHADLVSIAKIRDRNDRFRSGLPRGWLVLSAGVVALGAAAQDAILARIGAFDDFEADDPWDVHDIGDLEIEVEDLGAGSRRELIFFRIVDLDQSDGDRAKGLVVMLASEW